MCLYISPGIGVGLDTEFYLQSYEPDPLLEPDSSGHNSLDRLPVVPYNSGLP